MKNEKKENLESLEKLTLKSLEKLKNSGFRFVQIKSLTKDNRMDYMEPHRFILVPVKELPEDQELKGIYEPIESEILINWANFPDIGIEVLISL